MPSTETVITACREAIKAYVPLMGADVAFAGVLQDTGQGAALTLALGNANDEADVCAALAYALLMRACALADEAGDADTANACGDALELLDAIVAGDAAVRQ